jgi:polyketide biosynthesis enoyl-CoA hydratase PksH
VIVDVRRTSDLVTVGMTRPALSDRVVREVLRALAEAEADPACRTFALTGVGEDFCRGLDLAGNEGPTWVHDQDNPLWTLLERLTSSRLVTVALVRGRAEGGGVGLAAACDVVLAAPLATFQLTEVTLGLVPAIVLPFIARRVGDAAAFRLALTAEMVDARRAVRAGLADRMTPQVDSGLRVLRTQLRRGTPDAIAELKAYRNTLHPVVGTATAAARLFQSRLAAPDTAARLAALRHEGMFA